MTEQVILESTPLNALDRCDRCGAQAYVRATLATGGASAGRTAAPVPYLVERYIDFAAAATAPKEEEHEVVENEELEEELDQEEKIIDDVIEAESPVVVPEPEVANQTQEEEEDIF